MENAGSDLLQGLPAEQALGLTVYGHRRRGDCSDIETLVEPAGDTRAAIEAAVNAIQHKGKTPMTDAVIAAAEALRYTEEKATVILVSDGIETCHPDPCEAARLLEEAGIDFTVHVVGFNIDDPEVIAQMQCLAHETGGTFRAASNASELSEALTVVAEPSPQPEPEPVQVTIYATNGKNGPRIADDLVWDLGRGDAQLLTSEVVAWLEQDLSKGEYSVSVMRPIDEAFAEVRFGVGSVNKVVVLELPEYKPGATVEVPESAVAGSTVQVRWTGPDAQIDYIAVAPADGKGSKLIEYTYTSEGPLLDLKMPPVPGEFVVQYVLGDGRKMLAEMPISVTPVSATLSAPDELPAGADVEITWTGPDYQGDYITVSERGADQHVNYSYTSEGSPLLLEMPAEAGEYDLVYTMGQKRTIIARVAITVTGIEYSIKAPATAVAGARVPVIWTGPDYKSDFISVAEVGSDGRKYRGYTYTREGSPLDLRLPLEAGQYEIRYILAQDSEVQASATIEVTNVSAEIRAPASASVGDTVQVIWTGPNYKGDFVSIAHVGMPELNFDRYTYTRDGSPLDLELPSEPGEYVVRYIAIGNPDRALTSQTVFLEDVAAELTTPAKVTAGGMMQVIWQGPDYARDFIGIGKVGERYKRYSYTRDGSPLDLKIPDEPGEYEVRYYMRADDRVIATVAVTVE